MGNYHSEKREEERERHHFAILRAAMDVFSEQGYAGAKLDDIAARAELSKGSIYNHFTNKKDLFLNVIEWGEHQLLHQIREARKRCDTTRDVIEHTLRVYFRFFEKRESFFRVLIQEKYNFHDEIKTHFMKLFHENLKEFESDIEQGIQNGVIRDVDPHSSALMVNYIVNGLFIDWMHSGSKMRMIDLYNMANDFISHALYLDNKQETSS